MWAQKLQLITILGIIFAGLTVANADKPKSRFFSLIVGSNGEYCLSQSLDVAEWAMIKTDSCKDAALWQHGKNRTLILVADDEATDLCLTRRQNGFLRRLYVTLCYDGDNDSQSWEFNKKGELLLFNKNKKGDVLTINPNARSESSIPLVVYRRL